MSLLTAYTIFSNKTIPRIDVIVAPLKKAIYFINILIHGKILVNKANNQSSSSSLSIYWINSKGNS